jgi:protein involved in polysaccharide export with SLBB domain
VARLFHGVLLFILTLQAGNLGAQVVPNESFAGLDEQAMTTTPITPINYPALRVTRTLSSDGVNTTSKSTKDNFDSGSDGANSLSDKIRVSVPLPPNQFQRFILQATGQLLPLYGFNLFTADNGFSPNRMVPVPTDYPIGPGDEILIRAWGSIEIELRAIIDRNGLINIPRLGTVSLVGVRAGDVENVLHAYVAKSFRGFSLSASLGQVRGITVYLVGQARKPGTYVVSGLSTLVTALFEAGGPNENGSLRSIQVKRNGKPVAEIDLYAFLFHGDKLGDIKLRDGDVIVIPPAKAYAALAGEVRTPAVYELRGDDSVGSLLEQAAGLPVVADTRRAFLERIHPGESQPRSVEEFALDDAGLKKPLRSGDMLSVAAITPAFDNAVTLRGSVNRALRVPFRPGMRITDLIPNREFLLSNLAVRLQNNALLEHASLEAQREKELFPRQTAIWKHAKALAAGVDPAQTEKEVAADSSDATRSASIDRIGNAWEEINWSYAVVERINRKDMTTSLVPFDLGQALANPQGRDNLQLDNGDTVTVFSSDDIRIPIARRRVLVRIEGEVERPGVYQVSAGDSLRKLVARAGGLTPDAYLFGAEFYREAVRLSQQANMDKYIRQLEQETMTASARYAANLSDKNPASLDTAKLAQVNDTRERFLQRLRSVKSNGRISLGVSYQAPSLDQLPESRLENNDRLVIPSRPDYVQVFGAVNTESALFWQPGKSVSDYLALAGISPDADMDGVFVMRSDGSVASNTGRWFDSVTELPAQPGDIVVVREKTNRESGWTAFVRNAKDWTQILYQLGLGAAAFKSLD